MKLFLPLFFAMLFINSTKCSINSMNKLIWSKQEIIQQKQGEDRNPGTKKLENIVQSTNYKECLESKNNQELNPIIQLYQNGVDPYTIYQTTIKPIVMSCKNKIKYNKECTQIEKDGMACLGEKIN